MCKNAGVMQLRRQLERISNCAGLFASPNTRRLYTGTLSFERPTAQPLRGAAAFGRGKKQFLDNFQIPAVSGNPFEFFLVGYVRYVFLFRSQDPRSLGIPCYFKQFKSFSEIEKSETVDFGLSNH